MGRATRLLLLAAMLAVTPAARAGDSLLAAEEIPRPDGWRLEYGRRAIVFHSEVAYRGDSIEPLRGDRFYEAVGRRDLALEYRHRERSKSGSLAVAILMAYASYPMVTAGFQSRIESNLPNDKAIALAGYALDAGAL